MKYTDKNAPYVCMQTNSTCYKGTKKGNVLGVLWHSTGANNPTLKRYVQPSDDAPDREEALAKLGVNKNHNDWNHIKRNAGLNAWIGKFADGTVGTVQTMPWDFMPWGCGKGENGSCNDGWIQFEICEDKLVDEKYFNEVYREACELTAYLCKMFDLDPYGTRNVKGTTIPVLTCHADAAALGFASAHADVNHWFGKYGKSMETVRDDVAALLGKNPAEVQNPTASVSTSSATSGNSDNSKVIWDYLIGKLGNEYGVAGMIGNLYAESGLRPNNLHNSFEKKLGMDDATYTAAVDNEVYGNFIKDSAGYGLAQWTFWTRKQNLLAYAKSVGKSIGNLGMQLEYLWQELQGHKALLPVLYNAKSVYEASAAVLTQFEKPADQSETVKKKRAEYGQTFYQLYAKGSLKPVEQDANNVTQSSTLLEQKYATGDYKVVLGPMRIRSGPGLGYQQKKFSQMTAAAQQLNKVYADTGLAYYGVGTVFTALQIQKSSDGSWWAMNPSGWICLADASKVYCERR